MKRAKQLGGAYARPTCGNCDKTLKIKHDMNNVACVAQLKIMPADHPGECEYYRRSDAGSSRRA